MADKNKRSRSDDRREVITTPKTPFDLGNSVTVIKDRRFVPDRRINSIEVKWVQTVDTEKDEESEKTG